ncbi:MAG: NAD(P)-dependent glycerol-3-phosphate dehydrogenase [Gemmatimonadaceae bacterium]|nr:NAD(P)-dependent glycerol-3-phosphate dehydrogenase [Gemmatimonadaceae bacterium]
MKCAVMGAGAWGTALANLLAENGHDTTIWCLEPDVAEAITHSAANPRFLAGASLAPTLRGTTDKAAALEGAALVLFASPSHVLRDVVSHARAWVAPGALAVVATKGIERHSFALMTDIVADELHGHEVVALSGPSFAAEVVERHPTAVVAASTSAAAAARVQQTLSTPYFRVYSTDDVTGVELGGALKNVMAVAAGMSDGLGLGFNTRAALITRGLAEMTRLGVAMGAHPQTFAGLAGMGDLVLTCTGSLSRNRQVGLEIGRGATLSEVLSGRETVAEGVITTESARELAQDRGVDMPIVAAVHRVLFEQQPARQAMVELMSRELRGERD